MTFLWLPWFFLNTFPAQRSSCASHHVTTRLVKNYSRVATQLWHCNFVKAFSSPIINIFTDIPAQYLFYHYCINKLAIVDSNTILCALLYFCEITVINTKFTILLVRQSTLMLPHRTRVIKTEGGGIHQFCFFVRGGPSNGRR